MIFTYLIPAIMAQIFNPTADLVIPIWISTKDAKAEIKTQPVKVKAKISKCSI